VSTSASLAKSGFLEGIACCVCASGLRDCCVFQLPRTIPNFEATSWALVKMQLHHSRGTPGISNVFTNQLHRGLGPLTQPRACVCINLKKSVPVCWRGRKLSPRCPQQIRNGCLAPILGLGVTKATTHTLYTFPLPHKLFLDSPSKKPKTIRSE
jgi:hypothetical protein